MIGLNTISVQKQSSGILTLSDQIQEGLTGYKMYSNKNGVSSSKGVLLFHFMFPNDDLHIKPSGMCKLNELKRKMLMGNDLFSLFTHLLP